MIERKLLNDNKLTVVGTLSNAEINPGVSKNGKEYIRGKVSVKCNEKVIEINFYTFKLTKNGAVSKLYNTYSTLDAYVGKRVSISGYIDEAKVPTNGEIRRGNSLYLTFINVLPAGDAQPDSATFRVSGFVYEGLKAVYDEDGSTIKDYVLSLGQANYNNSFAKILKFNVNKENTAAINSLNEKFTSGVTCSLNGELEFDVETLVHEVQQDFGPSITKTSQRSTKRYVITSGNLIMDDMAYTNDEISELLAGTQEDDKLRAEGSSARSQYGTGVTPTTPINTPPSTTRAKLI